MTKKYIAHCSSNFCGVEDWKEVWAETPEEAEEIAAEEWLDEVYPYIASVEEADND